MFFKSIFELFKLKLTFELFRFHCVVGTRRPDTVDVKSAICVYDMEANIRDVFDNKRFGRFISVSDASGVSRVELAPMPLSITSGPRPGK